MQDHLSNPELGAGNGNNKRHQKNLETMVNGGRKSKQPLLGGGGVGGGVGGGSALKSQSKYMRLENQTDTPLSQSGSDVIVPRGISMTSANGGGVAYSRSAGVFDDIHQQQQIMMTSQVGKFNLDLVAGRFQ